MPQYIWVSRRQIAPKDATHGPDGPGAVFVLDAQCHLGEQRLVSGDGAFLLPGAKVENRSEKLATVLVYGVTVARPEGATLACEAIDMAAPWLLRLDEVSFPPGAIAYRHTHPGPGFRYLRLGALHLQTDDHSFDTAPGSVWFEPAQSPVRATASDSHPETRFVRFMALPPDYRGQPTINILDPQDAARPKRQSTHRHVDQLYNPADHSDAG